MKHSHKFILNVFLYEKNEPSKIYLCEDSCILQHAAFDLLQIFNANFVML